MSNATIRQSAVRNMMMFSTPPAVHNTVVSENPIPENNSSHPTMSLSEIISRYKTEKVKKSIRKERLLDRLINYLQKYK